jgi:TP901 family phage tail tape measure protein
MALEAGAVYTRVGARLDDTGFDRFDRRVRQARAASAEPITVRGRMNTDGSSFSNYERKVAGTRTAARKDVVTEGKMKVDSSGFNRYEEHVARARTGTFRFGSTIAGVGLGGRAALLGVQGAAVGLGIAVAGVVVAGARFEQRMNAVKAVTGANREQMHALSEAALNLGASTGLGASKAAEAITELAKGGLDPATIAAGGLKGALALASAGGLELADAASVTANALNLFHLRGQDATHVADAFATAANVTTADVSDFALALSQGGSAAKAAGLDFDQTTVALEALASNGVKGSDAGTSLKSALTQIAAPTKQSAAEMAKLNLHFFDAHGRFKNLADVSQMLRQRLGGMTQQQRLQVVQTIAGTDGMRALLAIYDAGPRKIDKFATGLRGHGAAARQSRIQQEGLAGASRRVVAAAETLAIRLSTSLNPALTKSANAIAGFIRQLSRGDKASGDLGRAMRELAPILRVTGQVLSVIGRGFGVLVGAMSKSAVEFIRAVKLIGTGTVNSLRGLLLFLRGVFTLNIGRTFRGAVLAVRGALQAMVGVVRTGLSPVTGFVQRVFGGLPGFVARVFRGMGRIVSAAFGGIVGAVKGGIRFIAGGASTLLGILAKIADGASHLPFVGGKFRGLARDIRGLQRQVDRYRDSLKDLSPEERRQVRVIEDHADKVVALRRRLATLRTGTGEYRETAGRLRAEQGKLNTSLRNASPAARRAANGLGVVMSAAHSASGTVGDAADAIAKNVNDLAKSLQSKGIHFRVAKTPAARRSQAVVFGGAPPLSELTRAQGGWIGQPGARGMDNVRLAPPPGSVVLTGRQAAALGIPQTGANRIAAGFSAAGGVPVMAGRGEYLALPHEVPGLAARAAGTPYGSLDGLFASLSTPHHMARGGMVRVPGDPNSTGGRDRVNASVVDKVSAWVRRYHADIGYAFDPGGGHKSPGHNVTGTATDVYPGPGGSWDLLEAGLRVLARAGYTIYYGTHGIGTPLAGHGRGNHAHIEWGSASGGVPDVQLPHRKVIGPDGALKRIIQATIDRGEKAGNAYLQSLMATADAGMPGAGSPAASANMAYAQSIMPKFGWGADQWGAWRALGMGESGWITDRTNPSSKAFGVGQFLGGTLSAYAKYGAAARGNGRAQVNAMAHYIKDRYGSPAAAYRAWLSRSPHWYGQGGRVQRFAAGGTVHGFNRAELGLPKNASKAAMERAYRTGRGTAHGFHARDVGLPRRASHAQILARLRSGRGTVHGFHARDLGLGASATREAMLNRYRDLSSLGLVHYEHPVNPNAPQYRGPGGYQLLQHDLESRGRLLVDPADPESTRIHNAWVRAGQNLTIADADLNTTDDNSIAAAGYLDWTNRQRLAYWRRRTAYWQRQLRKRLSKSARTIAQARFEQSLTNLAQSTQDATSSHSDYVDRLSNRFPSPDDAGGAGGEAVASPAQIAEAAAAQFASFNAARSDLFVNFGRNFATATRDPFGTPLEQAAGLAAFGAGSPADTGPISDPRRTLVGSRAAGGVTQHVYVTLASPGETHTMTRSLFHEALGA